MKKVILIGVMLLGLAACGGNDNVQSCKDWLATASCGSFNFASVINCDVYDETSCDISPYFDCLTANTTCNNGVADTSGWAANCASKAQCN